MLKVLSTAAAGAAIVGPAQVAPWIPMKMKMVYETSRIAAM